MEGFEEEEQVIITKLNKIVVEGRNTDGISFKKVDMKTLNRLTGKVDKVIGLIATSNITQTNKLIKAAAVWVADELGLKKFKQGKKKEPWWKRRIEGDIKQLKKDINLLERVKKGAMGSQKEAKAKLLQEKYRVKKKGLTTVIEELKQRILAKSAKIKRYNQRIDQYRLNRLFKIDQKKVYNELNGNTGGNNDIPNAEESNTFWSDIWSVKKEQNKEAEWLNELKEETAVVEQNNVVITTEKVKNQCKKIPNWKAPGQDA